MKYQLINTKCILILCVIDNANKSLASNSDVCSTGRYLSINEKPNTYQISFISQTMLVRFLHRLQTNGDAMNYLMRFSSYSLIPNEKVNSSIHTTLTKALHAVDSIFELVVLYVGLLTNTSWSCYKINSISNEQNHRLLIRSII